MVYSSPVEIRVEVQSLFDRLVKAAEARADDKDEESPPTGGDDIEAPADAVFDDFAPVENEAGGFPPGTVWLVVGRPRVLRSVTRSLLADFLRLRRREMEPYANRPILWVSLRAPRSAVILDLLAYATKTDVDEIVGFKVTKEDWTRLTPGAAALANRKMWVTAPVEPNFDEILAWVDSHPRGVVGLDGLDLTRADRLVLAEQLEQLAKKEVAIIAAFANPTTAPGASELWRRGDLRVLTGWEPLVEKADAVLFARAFRRKRGSDHPVNGCLTVTQTWVGQGRDFPASVHLGWCQFRVLRDSDLSPQYRTHGASRSG